MLTEMEWQHNPTCQFADGEDEGMRLIVDPVVPDLLADVGQVESQTILLVFKERHCCSLHTLHVRNHNDISEARSALFHVQGDA